ncbi:uncharacterized protein LOC130444459 [Diorhabda sublineata]|uniref:uncharacterized protein LOC130444459 n=1 Tax=Diorhabda sublineata TaxID=1163346 RepID=UPI0024E15D11|nr:uncharacterized protein LOC130444459 [Diorhabda sublineata]
MLFRLVKICDTSIYERIILCLSEFCATACFVFVGCLGCTSTSAEQISFTFGLAIMIVVQIFGHISGAHVNPAVTVAATIFGNIPIINVPIYFFGQILGAISGYGLVKATFANYPMNYERLCSPTADKNLSISQVFLTEFLLTLILIWVCCAIWDQENVTNQDSLPLRLGFTVTALAMAGSQFSGANINPARSFGPALLNGTWDHHWVYWLGPILAAFIGALFYKIIFGKKMKRWQIVQLTDKMSTKDRIVLCAAEIGGTAILLFLGCLGCVNSLASGGFIPHEQISFTFGLAVMVAIQVFGHISGAHINPIVTVAAATLGDLPLIQVPIYFVGQLIGSLLGFGLLLVVTPEVNVGNVYNNITGIKIGSGVCSPGLHPNITTGQGLFVEFLLSLILVLFCCGIWDRRNKDKHDSVPIKFGLAVAVLAMAGGPYTGANMNPARSFAPALLNGDWNNHWIYWIGPLAAGFVGGLLYRLIFRKPEPPSKEIVPEGIALNAKNMN